MAGACGSWSLDLERRRGGWFWCSRGGWSAAGVELPAPGVRISEAGDCRTEIRGCVAEAGEPESWTRGWRRGLVISEWFSREAFSGAGTLLFCARFLRRDVGLSGRWTRRWLTGSRGRFSGTGRRLSEARFSFSGEVVRLLAPDFHFLLQEARSLVPGRWLVLQSDSLRRGSGCLRLQIFIFWSGRIDLWSGAGGRSSRK